MPVVTFSARRGCEQKSSFCNRRCQQKYGAFLLTACIFIPTTKRLGNQSAYNPMDQKLQPARRRGELARRSLVLLYLLFLIFFALSSTAGASQPTPQNIKSREAASKTRSRLQQLLKQKKLRMGSPLFIRIFKHERLLELWLENSKGTYTMLKSYIICYNSGSLGPKEKEGDRQSPEGFYTVSTEQLNPKSNYHLSFNLGYPNEYDQYHQRTGSALMIHGRCSSAGCFAMTDYFMDEIYALADAALANGQIFFAVHIFPFKFSENGLPPIAQSYPEWHRFWLNLYQGYRLFETYRRVPEISVIDGRYSCLIPPRQPPEQ